MNNKNVLHVSVGLLVAGLLATPFLHSQINQQQYLMITLTLLAYLGLVLARLQSTSRNLSEILTDLEK